MVAAGGQSTAQAGSMSWSCARRTELLMVIAGQLTVT